MKLGKAFSDSVTQEKRSYMRTPHEESDSWWLGMGRLLMFFTVLCIAFFILIWRLFDLTVIQGYRMRTLADGNRTRELIRHAPRGILYDRTGKPLVVNIPYYRLLKPCTNASNQNCVTPVSREEGDMLSSQGLPAGTFLEVDYRREYLYPDIVSQVLGYTGELTQRELDDSYYKLRDYKSGDRVGRTGAEAVYEDRLRGRDGKELVEVDAQGKVLRTLGREKETPGEDITLSIDVALQASAAAAFPESKKGAVIVTKPGTGEILAMYSSPTFDLNEFSSGLTQQQYDSLANDPDQPLFDRALGGVYPPGSTFKIVLAIAALEEGAVTKDTIIDDVGVLTVGNFTFPNWYFLQYGKTEGPINIVTAIKRSNDVFFYKVGEFLGITKLAAWARKLGLGKPLGVELGGEASGLMPDPAWKKQQFNTPADIKAKNDEWYLGDTYHVAIGQGYLLVTPMQVNTWTNVVAGRGAYCRPTIQKITGLNSAEAFCKNVGIQKETTDLITEGMFQACQTGGTGWPLFDYKVSVACKTGTAEYGDPQNKTHAWFTSFAPVPAEDMTTESQKQMLVTGDPELSVTVLVEGAGEGSNVAAPIARKIYEAWFTR
jgi:penicillin-binding protein 2